jgi:16S rRNA (uracil1498-N3)-methyltransferase
VPAAEYGWAAGASAAAHVFVPTLDDECAVEGDDGHHLQRVRRLRAGEHVTAADGTGAWRRYEIVDVATGRLDLHATGSALVEPELRPRLCVALALTKDRALDDVVGGLTELGVHRIEPVRSERSVVRWDDRRAAVVVERLRAVAREAAMQSRRARIVEIAPVGELASLRGRPGLVVADRRGSPAGQVSLAPSEEIVIVVGPEGGLAPDELNRLGAPRVSVGQHVLRARTAPLAVVAAFHQHTTPVPDVVN